MQMIRSRLKRGRRWLAALAAGAALVAQPVGANAPETGKTGYAEAAHPALWIVADRDTTIYLFGTFHALDGRANWFDNRIRQAFDSSDELVLETLVPSDPNELRAIFARQGLNVAASGSNERPIDKSTAQTMSAGKTVGMSVDLGADAVLRRAAEIAGKPVGGLESFEGQLQMFRRLPAASQAPVTRQAGSVTASSGNPVADAAAALQKMQDEWVRGDTSSFAALVGAVDAQSPAAYRLLFANRNAVWAKWIALRLKAPGTVFMAVGTGHLVGRDSVQSKLRLQGIGSARIG